MLCTKIGEDGIRVVRSPRITGGARTAQSGAGMRDDDRVGVDVHHTAAGADRLRDLMRVLPGGQPAAQVQELRDAFRRQPLDGSGQEQPALPGEEREPGQTAISRSASARSAA